MASSILGRAGCISVMQWRTGHSAGQSRGKQPDKVGAPIVHNRSGEQSGRRRAGGGQRQGYLRDTAQQGRAEAEAEAEAGPPMRQGRARQEQRRAEAGPYSKDARSRASTCTLA